MNKSFQYPPTKIIRRMYFNRLGLILFNFSVLSLIISISHFFSWLIIAFIAIILVLIIFCTLGAILFISPEFLDNFNNIINSASTISEFLFSIIPIVSIATFSFSILSIIFLSLSKKSHKGRIMSLIIIGIISIIIYIVYGIGIKA
ncbi:MAG: hypothetical protein ACI35S_08000 [Anaeroplasma sp.]